MILFSGHEYQSGTRQRILNTFQQITNSVTRKQTFCDRAAFTKLSFILLLRKNVPFAYTFITT